MSAIMMCPVVFLNFQTERCRRVVNTPRNREVPVSNLDPRRKAILTEAFRGFPQSLQANAGIIP
jgi:hypothetical protein